jgi:hypothetical protein
MSWRKQFTFDEMILIMSALYSTNTRGWEPWSGQTKTIYLVISASPQSTQHFLRRKIKVVLARNQDNARDLGDMSTLGLSFQ